MYSLGRLLLVFALVTTVNAQLLYHKDNDEAAKKALDLSKNASMETGLQTALKNLDLLADKEAQIELTNLMRETRANIDAIECWGAIIWEVCSHKDSPPVPGTVCSQIIGKEQPSPDGCQGSSAGQGFQFPVVNPSLAPEVERLKAELDASKMQTAATSSDTAALDTAADVTKQAQDYYEKALGFLKDQTFVSSHQGEFEASKAALGQLSTSLAAAAKVEKERSALNEHLKGLSEPLASLERDRLQAELEHAEALLRIGQQFDKERRYLQQNIIKRFERDLAGSNVQMSTRLTDTFSACSRVPSCNRDVMVHVSEALALYSSASVWGTGSQRLNDLRRAREEHQHSLRLSIVDSHAADLVLSSGVQRLALYHQGGLRPEVVAQLIYAAATLSLAAR